MRGNPQLSEKGAEVLFPFQTTYLCKEAFKEERIPVLYIFFELVEEEGILLNSFYETDLTPKPEEKKIKCQ